MPIKACSEIDVNINNQYPQTKSHNNNTRLQKYNSASNYKNNSRNKKMNNKTKLELLKKEINELYDKMQKTNIENYNKNYNINNNAMNRNHSNQKKMLVKNQFSKTYDNLEENNNIINNYYLD